MKRGDPVRKVLVRVAILSLIFGVVATAGLIVFFPTVPILFKLGLPAVSMMTAANIYALASRPRGEYTRRTVDTFNRVYRPLKPLDTGFAKSDTLSGEARRGDPAADRPE